MASSTNESHGTTTERTIDCSTCGAILMMPVGLPEGAEFVCPVCGDVFVNVEATRTFDWDALDPYEQLRGTTRGSMTASTLGACSWLLILVVNMVARGRFDFGLLLALAAPYAGIIFVLIRGRAGFPGRVFMGRLLALMGAYLVYMAALMTASTRWADLLLARARSGPAIPAAMAIGAGLVIVAWMQIRFHRSLVASTPTAILVAERNPGRCAPPGSPAGGAR